MAKIIACIDGSQYIDSVCALSSWASIKAGLGVNLLHTVPSHDEFIVQGDLSGAIGLGVKSSLLKKLTEIDEERTKLHQQKGRLMLEHAFREISAKGISNVDTLYRRGSLSETLVEINQQAEIIIMGKFGENNTDSSHLGINIKKVVRTTQKPILIAAKKFTPIKSFLIAYDGSKSAKKAVEYVCRSQLFQGLDCHLLTSCQDNERSATTALQEAEIALKYAGFMPKVALKTGSSVDEAITKYIAENNIDLLAMGAFGHSKIRNFILGSATHSILSKVDIASMLFG